MQTVGDTTLLTSGRDYRKGGGRESELKLLKVAAGSLDELHEDYEDWLRTRNHPIWAKDSCEMKAL